MDSHLSSVEWCEESWDHHEDSLTGRAWWRSTPPLGHGLYSRQWLNLCDLDPQERGALESLLHVSELTWSIPAMPSRYSEVSAMSNEGNNHSRPWAVWWRDWRHGSNIVVHNYLLAYGMHLPRRHLIERVHHQSLVDCRLEDKILCEVRWDTIVKEPHLSRRQIFHCVYSREPSLRPLAWLE